jgi:hypothetical protein
MKCESKSNTKSAAAVELTRRSENQRDITMIMILEVTVYYGKRSIEASK